MIDYRAGFLSFSFIWRYHGSVFPKALCWAVPSAVLAYTIGHLSKATNFNLSADDDNMRTLWQSFQYMLGFLCVFRTQQAYGRYMEGALLLRQMRTEWINAVGSLVSFSSQDPAVRDKVERFQHLLIRLMSLLSCYTLQSMADSLNDDLPIINLPGLDPSSIHFLQCKYSYTQRCEIVKQWIQRLVVEQAKAGVIVIEPPILSRFFQDFDRGMVAASQARNLTDIPFPFPYAQVMTVMLLVHAFFTPMIAGLTMFSESWGAFFTFISVLAFMGTNYIACEIESPFGEDANDLPLVNIQHDMNASLWMMLEKQTRTVPEFVFCKIVHRKWATQMINDPVFMPQVSDFAEKASRETQANNISMFDSHNPLAWTQPRHSSLSSDSDNKRCDNNLNMGSMMSVGGAANPSSMRSLMCMQMNDLILGDEDDSDGIMSPLIVDTGSPRLKQDEEESTTVTSGRQDKESAIPMSLKGPIERPWSVPNSPHGSSTHLSQLMQKLSAKDLCHPQSPVAVA